MLLSALSARCLFCPPATSPLETLIQPGHNSLICPANHNVMREQYYHRWRVQQLATRVLQLLHASAEQKHTQIDPY